MDSQTDGLLFRRALKLFSPDIFQHPVWIRFADSLYTHRSEQILQLARATKQMEVQGDWSGACQLLILCALQHSRSGDYSQALETIQFAGKLAEQHQLKQTIIWSAWGACALCIQTGDYQRAADHLKHLQEVLKNSGDWVLLDLVQLIQQYLRMLAEAGEHPAKTETLFLPNDPLLGTVIHSLLHWGEVQEEPKIPPTEHKEPEPPEYRAREHPSAHQELLGWRASLQKVWRLLRGETKVSRIEDGKDDAATAAGMPILKPLGRPGEIAFPKAHTELFPAQLLLPADSSERRQLVIYCLGSFRVYQQDQPVDEWLSQKGLSVLKYLSTHLEKPVAKDILMDLFWPEAESEIARRNLHQAVYALRQTLRRRQPDFPYIQFENDCYRLNPELEIWLDVKEFERYVRAGRDLGNSGRITEAVEAYGVAEGLYQGDFLEEDLYDDWPRSQRMHFQVMYLSLLDRLAEYYLQRGEFTPAIGLCQKMLAKDNCCEQAYRWMIQCYLAQRQRHLAVREYQTCVQALKQELALEPSTETKELYRQIVG